MERLAEHAHAPKHTFDQHLSGMNELVEEYLRRIHHAAGMPSEQAIDASPRGRALAPSIALRAAVSGVHFITPPSRQLWNVNHSVCLML
jgi:hypothetical protein